MSVKKMVLFMVEFWFVRACWGVGVGEDISQHFLEGADSDFTIHLWLSTPLVLLLGYTWVCCRCFWLHKLAYLLFTHSSHLGPL